MSPHAVHVKNAESEIQYTSLEGKRFKDNRRYAGKERGFLEKSICPASSQYCPVDCYIARHLELTPCIALLPVKGNSSRSSM
jgi:hypothetical protein